MRVNQEREMMNMENKYTVYAHINKINGKIYIGITGQKPEVRWNNGIAYKKNKHFYSSIKKYGWNNFEHSIIASNLNEKEAKSFEVILIAELGTMNQTKGYNLTSGGDGTTGHVLTDEAKIKIGLAQIGKEISQNHRDSLINQFTGEGNPFYGKEHSDRTKKLISQNRIENGYSKGGNNCKAKKVICDNIIYDCAGECADFYSIKSGTLRSWLRGDRLMPLTFINMNLSYI